MRVALKGIVDVFQRHAALLRTSHEVTMYDPEFAAFYNDRVMKRFVSATAEQLRRDRAGRPVAVDGLRMPSRRCSSGWWSAATTC